MLLHQLLTKDKDKIQYVIENLSSQPLYWCVYRKKVVMLGAAPVERLSEPVLIQPGETAKIAKPDIKLPWKRYLVFAQDAALLGSDIKESEFNALLNIWVDEIGTVILTEQIMEDGVRAVRVSSWAAWSARKKMAPAAAKLNDAQQSFLADIHGKMLAGMEPHAFAKDVARVRHGAQLCSDELQFNSMRAAKVRAGIKALTGVDISTLSDEQVPRIQICASGGGYRAMISTLGSLIGMEDSGILDCVTAMSGLSGSTWAMAAWNSGGLSLKDTRNAIAEKVCKDFYTNKLWPDTIKNHIKERTGFAQELGLVDVMGWHLHHHLMKDLPSKASLWNHPRLSEQAAIIADGSRPLPIYTAVAHEHKRYRWCEFTPFEVGIAQDINCFVPTWSFGRKFKDGTSYDFAVEPSLSLLQATWGSAFCATIDQMFHELQTEEGQKEPVLQRLMHTLVYDHLEAEESRLITPAKFPNFACGVDKLNDHPWRNMNTVKLMDAGVHTNLPFPPLLRPERQTDIIIALDQSSAPDIFSSVSIDIVEKWARDEKLAFPDSAAALAAVPPSTEKTKYSAANEKRVTVIPGDVTKGIPTIIYLPLLRNDNFSKDFCPRQNALTKGGYCSTFNFKYTPDQVHQLSGLTEQNIKDSRDTIAQCIKDVTQQKLAFVKSK